MANIFTCFYKAADDDIANQVALLECVTLENVMKPYGQKARQGAVRAIRKVAGFFDTHVDIAEPKVRELDAVVAAKVAQLRGLPRTRLDSLLRQALSERVRLPAGHLTEELISAAVIHEAARLFSIDAELTPAQQADCIYQCFYERMLINLRKALQQDAAAQHRFEQELDVALHTLPAEHCQLLQGLLHIDRLTGAAIREALLRADTPALVLSAEAGVRMFMATAALLHVVFAAAMRLALPLATYTGAASLLGLLGGPVGWALVFGIGAWQVLRGAAKINQEMLAQCVYCAVVAYRRPVAPLPEELPGWVPLQEQLAIRQEDVGMQKLQRECAEYRQQLDNTRAAAAATLTALQEALSQLAGAVEEQENAAARLSSLQYQKRALEQRVRDLNLHMDDILSVAVEDDTDRTVREPLREQYRELLAGIKSHEQLLTAAGVKEKEYDDAVAMLKEKNARLVEQKTLESLQLEQKEACLRKNCTKRLARIMGSWQQQFTRFIYEKRFQKSVGQISDYKVVLAVEKILYELQAVKDMRVLAVGCDQQPDSPARLSVGYGWRLYYDYAVQDGYIHLLDLQHMTE